MTTKKKSKICQPVHFLQTQKILQLIRFQRIKILKKEKKKVLRFPCASKPGWFKGELNLKLHVQVRVSDVVPP